MEDFYGNQNNGFGTNNQNNGYQSNQNQVNNGSTYHYAYNSQQNQNTGFYSSPNGSTQQNNGGFYQPPTQGPIPPNDPKKDKKAKKVKAQRMDLPPEEVEKKKRRTIIAIVVALVICLVIAIAAVSTSSYRNNTNSSTQKETTTQNSEGNASVKSSNSAEKKDSNGNLTAVGVAEECRDSCVGITTYSTQSDVFGSYGSSQSSGKETASGEGSGILMSEANGKTYVLTCAHVISGASKYTVTLNNKKEYSASLVGLDTQTDVGVLVIEATGLKIAEFGDSDDIAVGESCVAIGCPGGLEFLNSVTQGIVSALDRPVSSNIGYSNKCIQVDAAINPGNSGGALFNMQGQVIGVNSSKIASTEYEGMGFAIPSNVAIKIANSLISNGYVANRAKIGLEYTGITNYNNYSAILSALEEKGYKDAQGAMVINSISSDSSLAKSDVQQYDIIVAVDKETLTSTDVMTSKLSSCKPGDKIKLTIARISGNEIKTFDVECTLIEQTSTDQEETNSSSNSNSNSGGYGNGYGSSGGFGFGNGY